MKFYCYTLMLLSIVSCCKTKEEKLVIAAAANMQFAIKEIRKEFTKKTGIKCDIILASSGKLTSQIKQGAPFDLFLSADLKYPTIIYNERLALDQPKIYAHGNLILLTALKTITPSINLLSNSSIKHIALANPKNAPYGAAAMEVLKYYQLDKKLNHKLVFGQSISQVNQFISTKVSKIGFTNKSITQSNKTKGLWIDIPKHLYTPIEQGIVVLKKSRHKKKAMLFYHFIFSHEAQKILLKYGYSNFENHSN